METREKIIRAAEQVIRSKGLARATTREIARAAGLSEGALYKHFESKVDLFLNLLKESPTNFIEIVMALPRRAGVGTVEGNLQEVAMTALDFYSQSLPMAASLFAEPDLLVRNRELLQRRGAGPQKANEALSVYLRAERDLGRVRADLDPEAAAHLLLGACFQQAFLVQFLGREMDTEQAKRFVTNILGVLMPGLG